MMPEEKAKSLLDIFNKVLNDEEKSKECAKLCVEEIDRMSGYNSDYLYGINYWNKVKINIIKYKWEK
jgi:hypothetical protein